jgi:hypothetical protein
MSTGAETVCSSCGEATPAAGRFCIHCAAPVDAALALGDGPAMEALEEAREICGELGALRWWTSSHTLPERRSDGGRAGSPDHDAI